MDGGFFCLCGDVAACGYHDERVGLAVQVFDVEPPEKDRGCGDNSLTQGQAFAQHRDDYENMRELESGELWRMEWPTICKIDVEEVDMLWRLDILEILATSLLERSTVYDPTFTGIMCWIRMRIQEMRAAPTCVSSPRSRSPLKHVAAGQSCVAAISGSSA